MAYRSMKIAKCTLSPAFNHQKQPPEVGHKKGVIKNISKFTEKHLCWICVEFVLDLCWICVGFVLNLCWICVEFVLNLCWICVEFVLNLCWVQFFNKVAGLMNVTLLERTLRQKYFSLNFAKFWKTSFLQNTSGRLLLNHDNTNGQLKTSKSCYLWKPNYWVEILENIVNFLQQSWGNLL